MQWIKWIRKNRQTVMTVAVIVLMVAFVGGYGLEELLMRMGQSGKQTFATYGDGMKITNQDMATSARELETLKAIGANQLLFSKQTLVGTPDVTSMMLGYLLFGDSQIAGRLRLQLHEYAKNGQVPLSISKIDEFFTQDIDRPDVTWILLSNEARDAGIVVSNEQSAAVLRQVISQMSQNQSDPAAIIRYISNQIKVEPVEIISTFGKLLAVLNWATIVCDNENVTTAQIQSTVGRMMERIDVECVKFPSDWFVSTSAAPAEDQIKAHFEAYKNVLPGEISDQNPYGFGYMLPHRVQMEYFIILSDDVKKQIEKPNAEALESYYSSNIERYRTQTPVDPNKPDGEQITTTKTFAEVSSDIYRTIERERTQKLMQLIMKDAKDWLDENMLTLDMEKATADQLQQASGDYSQIAARITEKYKVPVAVGRTGQLSRSDLAQDDCLNDLQVQPGMNLRLADVVFAVSTDSVPQKSKIMDYVPRMWANVGPMNGGYYSQKDAKYFEITAICRVINIQKATPAESVDTEYNVAGAVFDKTQADQKVFQLKKQVTEDLRKQLAMTEAAARAEEFKQLIAASDWDKAIEQYNTKYAPKDPNTVASEAFRKLAVTSLPRQLLISDSDLARMRQIAAGNPAYMDYMKNRAVNNMLNKLFFAILGDRDESGVISETFEFKPGLAWYVTKSIKRQPAAKEDYLDNKIASAMQTNLMDTVGLGLVHFNPQNIRTRLNYTPVIIQEAQEAADAPADQASEK
ncbi:MAG: hypothetical protein JXB18_04335 [Sedimentisphaerales bacterium]|nr:hypothetical protein [Sedimentisphaerales bacterium]